MLDAASGEPVSGAAVVVKGKTIGAPTELTGNFTLHIPASVPPESTTITFSYIGFVTQEVKLDYLLQNPALVIRLALDNTALMGETFIIHSKWYSPRRLYYSIRNLFR